MNNWKTCKLSELGDIVGGATPSTKNIENYKQGTIPWITPKDLSNFSKRYISNGERYITEKGFRSCSTQMLPKNSILFSSRAPIGYIAIANNELCTNQGFKSIIPNKDIDYLFLYYLLKYQKNEIENLAVGSTFKEVSGIIMKNIVVQIPQSIEEQRRISTILDNIDTKIELNNAINKNLS
ncbi:MAG: restriction endonuclease subunit S, partial [Succinivibrionaceae bacterium]